MTQDGRTRRFLYVEVPLPTERALAVRSAQSDIIKNTTQAFKPLDEVAASENGRLPLLALPSLKGKERQVEDDQSLGDASRSGSPQQRARAASDSARPAIELETLFDDDNLHAGPSKPSLLPTNTSTSLQAPASLHTTSSNSSNLTAMDPQPEAEVELPKQKTNTRRRRRKKRVIAESDASDQNTPSSTIHESAVPGKKSSMSKARSASSSTQPIDLTDDTTPEYTSLGVDEEITKILGRKRCGQEYAYTVKLKEGQRTLVPESALHTYQDLLDDWLEIFNSGWREDGQIYSDSESGEDNSTAIKRQLDSDEAYSDDMRGDSPDSEEDSSDEDASSDESDDIPLQVEATRRSQRDAAQKKVDYSKQEEYNEDDEDMSDGALTESESGFSAANSAASKSRSLGSNGKTAKSRPKAANKRSQASPSADNMHADEETEEEFIEGGVREEDLRPEQFHCRNCSFCKASSARELLPEFIKKEKRKRKKADDDGDWTADSVREYGCWVWCEVCSSSWHWKCLPGQSAANGLKIRFKKKTNAKYGQRAHLNINKTLKIQSCPDCLKPHGATCKFCLKSETVHDITKDPEIEDPTIGPLKDQEAPSAALPTEIKADSDQAAKHKPSDEAEKEPPMPDSTMQEDHSAISSDKNLLSRCTQCRRAAHYSCIPTPDAVDQWQYSWDWHCDDCKAWGPIDAVLAWRPLDWEKARGVNDKTPPPASPKRLDPGSPGKRPAVTSDLPDHKLPWWNAEYLVKFKETSFRNATWVPHSWLYSAYRQRLRNFLVDGPLVDIKPDNSTRDGEEDVEEDHLENFNLAPTPDAFDKIPKEWLTPDRILDVSLRRKSGSGADPRVLNMKNRISNDPEHTISRISKIYVKWQGLPYDAATWEEGFPREGEPQYMDFVRAYSDYLKFRNVEIPRPGQKELAILDRARPRSQFKELTAQPDFITLGKLMDFQLLGVSWLYFNWWIKKGCILADEMGLGKTVQIISFLSILFRTENCKPFLVVVPNSTLQNWQREFARWAPDDMRVVPYYGNRTSRRVIEQFELYTEGAVGEQKLRTHVVLTTYECLTKDTAIFKRVPRWEALVVDEAQRLKSGPKNLLWGALKTLRFGHSVLLTGTPVNNNLSELFNLLYFLDPPSFPNLDELGTRYETLTPELVDEIQSTAQPYFLRRTKEAVLNLPSLSEVIVPLSMSPLQKIVYKSVLEKNMDALKAIYDASKAKTKKKVANGKCRNVLMELRKTLCHPYLVRDELEHDTNLDANAIHKNLVEASSKLEFLADFLPKLKERGHRVLLFSQFVIVLNVIERFLEGMKVNFVRLDGNTSQAQRQKNIDAYNAPDSDIFIFILTTRAGGVGINLATADTVIMFDADFNPFQDLQAISRAHRIGQKKKVMCFKLMVKGTCEEKIIETGKKKMVLEQLIIDSKDLKDNDDDEAVNNVESLLLFGAKALFTDEPGSATQTEITYSSRDMDDLIAKTENENASPEEIEAKQKRTIEANKAFSYARVWDRQVREQEEEADKQEVEAQRGFWSKMIEAKEKEKKDEELARALQMGRGYRRRQEANYSVYGDSFAPSSATSNAGRTNGSDTGDDDYDAALFSEDSDAEEAEPTSLDPEDLAGLDLHHRKKAKLAAVKQPQQQPPAPLAPIRPTAPLYVNPLPLEIAPNQPPHTRYELVRSPTPPEISEKRTALLKNLLKRAELLQNKAAVEVLRQATKVSTGFEQIILCQKAAALLTIEGSDYASSGLDRTPPSSSGIVNQHPTGRVSSASAVGMVNGNEVGSSLQSMVNGHASTSSAPR